MQFATCSRYYVHFQALRNSFEGTQASTTARVRCQQHDGKLLYEYGDVLTRDQTYAHIQNMLCIFCIHSGVFSMVKLAMRCTKKKLYDMINSIKAAIQMGKLCS